MTFSPKSKVISPKNSYVSSLFLCELNWVCGISISYKILRISPFQQVRENPNSGHSSVLWEADWGEELDVVKGVPILLVKLLKELEITHVGEDSGLKI